MTVKSRSQLKAYKDANRTTNASNSNSGATENIMWEDSLDSSYIKSDDNTEVSLFDYVASRSYVIGQGVFYLSEIYRCINNTTGTFNPSHWSKIQQSIKDEFSFTQATVAVEMTLISGYKYQRTHSLNTNTPKLRITRPNGYTFADKDLNLKIIDVNTIQLDFGFEIDSGTTYVLIER